MTLKASYCKAKIHDLISDVAMFRTICAEELDTLTLGSKIVCVGKGDALFHQGEPCTGFYMVISGGIRLVFTSPDGREHIAKIANAGDHFAEAVMFLGATYPLDAFATDDAELLFIGKQAVDACLVSNPEFSRILVANLSAQLQHFANQIATLTLHNAAQRVIGYLLHQHTATSKAGAAVSFKIPSSKNNIASHLNISPETLSRTFRQLSDLNLMMIEGKTITITALEKFRNFGGF